MTRYCWRCAAPLGHRPPVVCGSCGQGHFDNSKPAADAVVVHDGRVLLLRRARDPWLDHWDTPGGFCDVGEHPVDTAERELFEETGYHGRVVALLGMWIDSYGEPTPDGQQEKTLNISYLAELVSERHRGEVPADEVHETRWFPLDATPRELAFPAHNGPALAAARQVALGDRPRVLPER
jgi:8-oxo-dGTP diphosphatase